MARLHLIKLVWDWVQSMLDLDGDVWLGVFTTAIVWKIVHTGLNAADAAAYGSAVAAFSYSNVHKS